MRGVKVVHRRIPVSHAEITRSYGCISSFVSVSRKRRRTGCAIPKQYAGQTLPIEST